jgi:hypothetical protein
LNLNGDEMVDQLDEFKSFVHSVLDRDGADLESVHSSTQEKLAGDVENIPGAPGHSESDVLEAIISLHRPVFAIVKDKVDPTITSNQVDDEVSAMAQLVKDKAAVINSIIPSIGRIDLPGDENYPWVGTGWIVDSELGNDIVITNAHVAQLFAESSAAGFSFKTLPFLERSEAPILDFRRELAETPPRRFNVLDIIYIGRPGLLDVAFLRVARSGDGALSAPLKLAKTDPEPNLSVATIGYPGTDRGNYDLDTLLRVYGNVFNTKRCAPGKVVGIDSRGVSHDCSTMPGSSGSNLFDLVTGEAVGLHFQGVPFRSNHAVPASAIRKLIKDQPWRSAGVANVGTSKPATGTSRSPSSGALGGRTPAKPTRRDTVGEASSGAFKASGDENGVRIVLPLEITVRIGEPQHGSDGAGVASAASHLVGGVSGTPEAAEAAVKQQVLTNPNVVSVRATYLFNDEGQLSDQKGVVVKVRPEASRDPKDYGLESSVSGVPISIEMADLESLARSLVPEALEAPAKMQAYVRDLSDPRFTLDPITDDMTLTLHVSPEAGWRVLSKFFDGNDYDRVTIGMYNFTAPHIIDAVRAAIKPARHKMTLTLDRKSDDLGGEIKKHDWPEEKVVKALGRDGGQRFQWTPASVSGPGRLFATSYHIKVAVLGNGQGRNARDTRFWLSSGNWASSNQAPFDDEEHPLESLSWADVKSYDRDWHAVVVSEKLAKVFRNHLEQDFEDCKAVEGEEAVAPLLPDLIVPEDYFLEAPRTMREYRAFAPKIITQRIKVQPVLTPDNYPEVVLPLIRNATKSVLFVNQSFDIKEDEDEIPPHYRGLLDALLDRQKNISDVRIIFRSGFGKERDVFRRAVEFGFDKTRIRFFGTCHTKGIIVDNKRVLLGSQNWTGAGTKPNRDASLLIESEEAAQYFTDIFEFDWKNVATDRVPPDHGPTRRALAAASDEEAVIPAGFRVVPWGAWNGT